MVSFIFLILVDCVIMCVIFYFFRYYGELEVCLRDIFCEVGERVLSIIFIDEFDVLCFKRDKV